MKPYLISLLVVVGFGKSDGNWLVYVDMNFGTRRRINKKFYRFAILQIEILFNNGDTILHVWVSFNNSRFSVSTNLRLIFTIENIENYLRKCLSSTLIIRLIKQVFTWDFIRYRFCCHNVLHWLIIVAQVLSLSLSDQ